MVKKIGARLWNVIDTGQGRDVISASKTFMQLGDLQPSMRNKGDVNTQNIQVNMYNNDVAHTIEDIIDSE